jgi:hypothetical protein
MRIRFSRYTQAEVDLQRPDYHYLQVLAEMLDGRRREPVALIDRVAITTSL